MKSQVGGAGGGLLDNLLCLWLPLSDWSVVDSFSPGILVLTETLLQQFSSFVIIIFSKIFIRKKRSYSHGLTWNTSEEGKKIISNSVPIEASLTDFMA
jgi:hypothetical protein